MPPSSPSNATASPVPLSRIVSALSLKFVSFCKIRPPKSKDHRLSERAHTQIPPPRKLQSRVIATQNHQSTNESPLYRYTSRQPVIFCWTSLAHHSSALLPHIQSLTTLCCCTCGDSLFTIDVPATHKADKDKSEASVCRLPVDVA